MSGAVQVLRARHRANARPHLEHRTRAEYAEAMRAAAICNLRLPGMDREGIDNANEMLERVGDMLTLPRFGWYPRRPKGWKP